MRYIWATVAPLKAITVVIHEVLKFCETLTRISPNIKCDVPRGGCCMFIAGLHVDRLKHARMSVSGTPVKLFLSWLFFCISNTSKTFFMGISLIFLSGVFGVFVFFIASEESSTLPVSSIVPQGTVTPEPGTLLLATSRPAASTSSSMSCSTPGSPRVSLRSRIVTLRLLLGSALPLSGLVREAPSGTAHEEHPLQVWFFLPLSLMLVVLVAP